MPPRKRERRDRGGEEGHIRESEHGLLVKIEAPPQQKHIVCRKGEGERSNGDDGREERREGQRCERDGRCGGWLAREIMERCMEGREAGKGEGGEMNEARSKKHKRRGASVSIGIYAASSLPQTRPVSGVS